MKKHFGAIRPFKTVEPVDSKQCEIMQIVDIVLGAIGYDKNGENLLGGANPAKKTLVKRIADSAGLPNLRDNTGYASKRFTIWNIDFTK